MESTITEEELTELVRRTEHAADAYVRGDMDTYLTLVHHAHGFTLLPPYGGPARRYEDRKEGVKASADFFRGGEARLEHVETHAWGDTVVVAMIERQHSQVGGLPDQDCSLRVTHVYRRDGSNWQLVHRHADPLVRQVELEELASLMR